jgi:hypothetical protein
MENPLITFYFTVMWHGLFGVFSIVCSGGVGHAKKSAGFVEWLGHFAGSWSSSANLEAGSLVCYVGSLA